MRNHNQKNIHKTKSLKLWVRMNGHAKINDINVCVYCECQSNNLNFSG